MRQFSKLSAAITTSALLALGAAAPLVQAGGLYIGVGGYQADSDVGDDTVPAGFLGYTFVDTNFLMLSGELGYYDLGDTSNRTTRVEASAATAAAVVSVPLGPFFELYGKGGIAAAEVKVESGGKTDKNSDNEGFYGFGASIDILDTIDIYAEYLVFDTEFNSEMYGVGIKLAF